MLDGVRGCGGAGGNVELDEDVADVPVHRFLAESEFPCDGLVGAARGDKTKNLKFALAQIVRGGALAGDRQRVEPGEIGPRPEFSEDASCRFELKRRPLGVAELPAGRADKHAKPRRQIGRAKVVPDLERAA